MPTTYIEKVCLGCSVVFNTRPFYDKQHCRKCWNNIRMKTVYRTEHPIKRTTFVAGDHQESCRQYILRNKEKIQQSKLRYRYEKNGVLKDKEWQKNNPDKVSYSKKKNRLKRKSIEKVHTEAEWELLKEKHNYACNYCKRKEPTIKLTVDHKVSITKWESMKRLFNFECDDIQNIQPLCRSCNSKKNNKCDLSFGELVDALSLEDEDCTTTINFNNIPNEDV